MCAPETKILVVDDDAEIRDLLAHFLEQEHFRVVNAASGRGIDKLLSEQHFHLVLLDIMMPGEDGLSICRRIRATSSVPIILLTARGEEMDRVIGLEMGADDYIPKPFSPRELVARIKAVLWRTEHSHNAPITKGRNDRFRFDQFTINLAARSLEDKTGNAVDLSSGEFDLLTAFVRNPQRTLSRDQLLDLTQGRLLDPFDRSIDVQISRLRRKIESNPRKPDIIKTVRGLGYSFTSGVHQP
ncbi:MAG: two-component system OmpR family response regulator [Patiriisocius sp.]|jgi:two-component system OmpR family response regulator